ncbi:ribonuclease HI family protein [Thermoanaerobacterium thermosaccharolyticum]|uniref:ribonuclease HI family protein n=1 Tax=Thermoanaerobacterium thermosaccharolyticum TaxID=1517 RepID=UPI00177EA194|nr:reverse transcriptase-like protein [Thermoanaerobacterium thermosaccharolyticum]MBE0069813.1 reverse transcriptase-like protein [Thermoanaerobacterium thermosaccharolyticum]MBE0227523.1 reverse transcriptase-like protein [Thermoanaerobacterium thermosaccharolyticum]
MWYGYFDGCSKGNPGDSGIGGILIDENGEIVEKISKYIGIHTNNEAEYMALLELLNSAYKHGVKEILIHGDSQLVIEQITGNWKLKQESLRPYYNQCKDMLFYMHASFKWIPREKNQQADKLSNEALKQTSDFCNYHRGVFDINNLEKITNDIYIAHGTEDYAVDLLHNVCTCPAFKYYEGDCKHLVAAKKLKETEKDIEELFPA